MVKINVDYNKSSSRFIIECPYTHNNIPKNLPNRKFLPKLKVWAAPSIRSNVEYMMKNFVGPSFIFTDDALTQIDECKNKYLNNAPSNNGSNFPVFYPFKTKPRQKQLEALNKIYGLKSSALFMDMRTGKSKVIIDLICAMRMEDKIDKALIICPLSIRRNWLNEFNIHSPFPVSVYLLDTSKPKTFDEWLFKKDDIKVMIVGVESFSSGSAFDYCQRYLLTGVKTLTAVDESHKIKNISSSWSEKSCSLARLSETRLIATGTPTGGTPMDLFAQFEFLDPDIIGMGDYYSFRARYAVMGGFNDKQIIGYQNIDELMEIVKPFIFQVRQDEVFPDAPEKTYMIREVKMSPKQSELYRSMRKEKSLETSSGSIDVTNALEHMLRLQEITGGVVTYINQSFNPELKGKSEKYIRERIPGDNPKISELMDVIEEYPGQTIIWCAFVEEIMMVSESLRDKYGDDQVVEIHGGIDEEDRDNNVRNLFQTGKSRFIVGNTSTGGAGLTMSAADTEIYYSNTFKYIDRKQSEERAFGPDKKNGTLIIDIVMTNSVDEHVFKSMRGKQDVAEYIRSKIKTIDDIY